MSIKFIRNYLSFVPDLTFVVNIFLGPMRLRDLNKYKKKIEVFSIVNGPLCINNRCYRKECLKKKIEVNNNLTKLKEENLLLGK